MHDEMANIFGFFLGTCIKTVCVSIWLCTLFLLYVYGCKRRIKKASYKFITRFVGLPGLEPGKAGPESAVLPLHHSPIVFGCKGTTFLDTANIFRGFLFHFRNFLAKKTQNGILYLIKEGNFRKRIYLCMLIE